MWFLYPCPIRIVPSFPIVCGPFFQLPAAAWFHCGIVTVAGRQARCALSVLPCLSVDEPQRKMETIETLHSNRKAQFDRSLCSRHWCSSLPEWWSPMPRQSLTQDQLKIASVPHFARSFLRTVCAEPGILSFSFPRDMSLAFSFSQSSTRSHSRFDE